MNTIYQIIKTLLRSGITGEKLTLPVESIPEEVYQIVCRQSVAALAYQGAVNCGVSHQELMQKLFAHYYKAMLYSERQMLAIENLFQAFEQSGIPYMPLKGCNMKKLYPKAELRSMGDADILIHPEDHERIRPVMEKLGFQYIRENDHVFEWRSKQLYVELHKSLVPITDEDYFCYYRTGWQLGIKGEGSRYDLSAEDAYIFMFTHFARHFRHTGIGCRHVVDLYVYRCAYPDMKMDYVQEELQKLHLLEFHQNIEKMLDAWFLGMEENEITCLATTMIFSGGNWGTAEAGVFSNVIKMSSKEGDIKQSGLKATLYAFFPPKEQLSYQYESVRKYPVLLPVFWVVRWVDILLFKPWKIGKKLRILKTVGNDGVMNRRDVLKKMGLEYGSNAEI